MAFLKTAVIHWRSVPCRRLKCDALVRSVEPRPSFSELVTAAMMCCRLRRHGPLCAGSTTAPTKSPSKASAPALRRGFFGPASRPATEKLQPEHASQRLPALQPQDAGPNSSNCAWSVSIEIAFTASFSNFIMHWVTLRHREVSVCLDNHWEYTVSL